MATDTIQSGARSKNGYAASIAMHDVANIVNPRKTVPSAMPTPFLQAPTPVATVLMLAYNHGPYIRQAIESILKQKTAFPFELIIGEDCSTDDTRKIALEYQERFPQVVRVITSDKNVGAKANSRRIEQACRGLFVAYCEADDYWHDPDKLRRQVEFLEAHPDYAMVHCDFRTCYAESGKVAARTLGACADLDDGDAFNDILSGRRIIFTVTACVRRSVADEILRDCPECYDPRFLMGDTQRWLEIARRGKIKYFPEILATRHILSESASQSKDPSRVLRFLVSAKDVLDHYIEKYGCSPAAKQAATERSIMQLLKCAYEAADAKTAATLLAQYQNSGAPIPLQAYLFAFGSRGRYRKKLVAPAMISLELCGKIRRRVGQMVNS